MKKILFLIALSTSYLGMSQQVAEEGVLKELLTHDYKNSSYVDTSGKVFEGMIKYVEYDSYFMFKFSGAEKGNKLGVEDVKGFIYNNELNIKSINGKFYIKENEEEKIKVYKRFKPKGGLTGIKIVGGKILGRYSYYVSIENVLEIKFMGDVKAFTPFKKKVPAYLTACPELSEKVANKEKGYKTSLMKPALIVWLKLAREYEGCAK